MLCMYVCACTLHICMYVCMDVCVRVCVLETYRYRGSVAHRYYYYYVFYYVRNIIMFTSLYCHAPTLPIRILLYNIAQQHLGASVHVLRNSVGRITSYLITSWYGVMTTHDCLCLQMSY